jgi:hypothetical protein
MVKRSLFWSLYLLILSAFAAAFSNLNGFIHQKSYAGSNNQRTSSQYELFELTSEPTALPTPRPTSRPNYASITVAGTGVEEYSGDNGPADEAGLIDPEFMSFDSSGNLFFTDYVSDGGVIRRIDGDTGIITRYAGINGSAGFGGKRTSYINIVRLT